MVQVKQKAPILIERQYQIEQRKILNVTKKIIEDEVLRYLPVLLEQTGRADSQERMDDLASKIASLFLIANGKISAFLSLYGIEKTIQGIAILINQFNTKQFQKVLKAKVGQYVLTANPNIKKSPQFQFVRARLKEGVSGGQGGSGGIPGLPVTRGRGADVFKIMQNIVGIDTFADNPMLKETMNIWVVNNVNLIKTVNQDFLNQAEQIVNQGAVQGLRHEVIAKKILNDQKIAAGGELEKSVFQKAKTRANLIARDQVNKLNGNLNRLRQQDCGIEQYKWRGILDARERHSHVRLEGALLYWETGAPSLNGANPGDEIQCRCYGDPEIDLDAILGDV